MFLTLTNPNLLESEQIKTLTQSVNAKYITHKHNKKGQYFFDYGNSNIAKEPLLLKISKDETDGSAILDIEIPHGQYYSNNVTNKMILNQKEFPLNKFLINYNKNESKMHYHITHNGFNNKIYFEDIKSISFWQLCRFTRASFGTIAFSIINPSIQTKVENQNNASNKFKFKYVYEIDYKITVDSLRAGSLAEDRNSNVSFLEVNVDIFSPTNLKATNTFAKIAYQTYKYHDNKPTNLLEKVRDLFKFRKLQLIDGKFHEFNLEEEILKESSNKWVVNYNANKKFNYDVKTKEWKENDKGNLGFHISPTFFGNLKINYTLLDKLDAKNGKEKLIETNKIINKPLLDYDNGLINLTIKIDEKTNWKEIEENKNLLWKQINI